MQKPSQNLSGSDIPQEIVTRFLDSMRKQFFPGNEKLFYQEKSLLMLAIAYPARWLDDRAVAINAKRYTELLTGIIRTINAHGDLKSVRSPGRYLLHAVQEHMKHHGEDYYEIGKATRNAVEDALAGIRTRAKNADRAVDSTVVTLAETHRVLSAAKAGRKKKDKAPEQGSLF